METASAANWTVDDSGGADFTGIQEAINKASVGDTIIVHSGVYYENVVVDKSVTLKGVGHPVVDANGSGSAITLSADGITLEGFTAINSRGWKAGIRVSSRNNTITGNNVSNNYGYGIELYHSCNNNITGNNVSNNNGNGIYLHSSSNNNTITGNVFVNDGLSVYSSYQNTVEDNTVNGKPLVYLEDVSEYKVDDAGQVILVNCDNITVENLDLSNTSGGIALMKTKNSKISNNTVCNNNRGGIRLDNYSNNNTITGNNVSNNHDGGIHLGDSCNNTITGNNVSNNHGYGIFFYGSSNSNTITGNNVCNNDDEGIGLSSSSNNNTITGNNVSNNNRQGIYLYDSCNNNQIYLNDFINNSDNAYSEESTNVWNTPEEITYTYNGSTYKSYLGNYWDDYKEKYPDAEEIDSTGIWDTPYSIDGDEDSYPLMQQWGNYHP